jgi:sugar phosphate isomerase/epimerase
MRIGGPIFKKCSTPEEMIQRHRELGYSAAATGYISDRNQREEYKHAFAEADIVLAELGAYGINILDTDPLLRKSNISLIKQRLIEADEMGALCCVIHGGTVETGEWGNPHPDNTSERSFEETVRIVQDILDEVQPQNSKLVLEACYTLPHNPDVYLRLVETIDRIGFGVHLDPINMLTSPERYYNNAEFTKDCFAKLGPHIVSCHGKDVIMKRHWPLFIDEETTIGNGFFDWGVYLKELDAMHEDMPLLIEHLTEEQLAPSLNFLSRKAAEVGVTFKNSHLTASGREIKS